MKVVYSVFLAIFLCVFAGANSLEAQNKVSQQFPLFETNQTITKNAVSLYHSTWIKHSGTSKKDSGKHKKRNRKGVKPLLFGIVDDFKYLISHILLKECIGTQIPDYFSRFSANGKRGPPIC